MYGSAFELFSKVTNNSFSMIFSSFCHNLHKKGKKKSHSNYSAYITLKKYEEALVT